MDNKKWRKETMSKIILTEEYIISFINKVKSKTEKPMHTYLDEIKQELLISHIGDELDNNLLLGLRTDIPSRAVYYCLGEFQTLKAQLIL